VFRELVSGKTAPTPAGRTGRDTLCLDLQYISLCVGNQSTEKRCLHLKPKNRQGHAMLRFTVYSISLCVQGISQRQYGAYTCRAKNRQGHAMLRSIQYISMCSGNRSAAKRRLHLQGEEQQGYALPRYVYLYVFRESVNRQNGAYACRANNGQEHASIRSLIYIYLYGYLYVSRELVSGKTAPIPAERRTGRATRPALPST
jgi:hypothetical protein